MRPLLEIEDKHRGPACALVDCPFGAHRVGSGERLRHPKEARQCHAAPHMVRIVGILATLTMAGRSRARSVGATLPTTACSTSATIDPIGARRGRSAATRADSGGHRDPFAA